MADTPKEKLNELYQQLMSIREEMREVQKDVEPEPIQDYVLQTLDGPRALSSYFGDKEELFVVHNMGSSCSYCTLWADGFNGVLQHLENRVAWVMTSPDDPAKQQAFAESRGWNFEMASLGDSMLARDLGYELEDGSQMPGVTVVRKQKEGSLVKLADTPFGPGDPYCVVFNLFDLIPGGANDWQPNFSY